MKRLIITILMIFLSVSLAEATVYYVDAAKTNDLGAGTSWGTAKKKLESALLLATQTGDSVWIKNGVYSPPSVSSPYVVQSDVSVLGSFVGTESDPSQRPTIASNPSLMDLDSTGMNHTILDGLTAYSVNKSVIYIALNKSYISLAGC